MIQPLIEKIKKFVISDAYFVDVEAVAHAQGLDEDQTDMLASVTSSLLLGEITEKALDWHIADRCDIELVAGNLLARGIHARILTPFKKELATEFGYSALVTEQAKPTPIIQPAPTLVSTPNVIGADKLRPIVSPRHPHIENPPRRITDTSHLIDDTIEERPKLQDHYND